VTDAFFSYAKADAAIAETLHTGLLAAGCRVWFDVAELRTDEPWRDQVRSGIADARALLVLLSDAWVASPACAFELRCATERQKPPVVVLIGGSTLSIELPAALRDAAATWIREASLDRAVETAASRLRECRRPGGAPEADSVSQRVSPTEQK
jgi:hypothetical protein